MIVNTTAIIKKNTRRVIQDITGLGDDHIVRKGKCGKKLVTMDNVKIVKNSSSNDCKLYGNEPARRGRMRQQRGRMCSATYWVT